jgi:EAL domain-containing protein (putative c-di-GMP-specific phosphodiesterase class I)
VDKIENIIKKTKVNPKNIMLEITKNDEIKNTEKVLKNLKKLKAIGIGFIVLDDFGVGYSSFCNLVRYSIDIVKIDIFFIDRLKSNKYTGITASLIALIKNMICRWCILIRPLLVYFE